MKDKTKLTLRLLAIIIAAIGIGALWLLMPSPEGADAGAYYSPFGTPTTLVDLVLAIGGGLLFLRALHSFKKELKPAWRLVAVAQIGLGVLTLVFPIVEYYYLWPNIWWNMATYLPFLFGSVFMYLGARRFYKILGLHSRVTSLVVVGIAIIGGWGLHAFIPHIVVWDQFNEHQYDLFELIPWVPIVLYGAAAFMAFGMRSKVGTEYKKPFTWLAIGLSLQAIATITIGVLEVTGYENWYFASRAYEIPTIVGDIGILTAAYYFNAIGLASSRYSLWQRLTGTKPRPVTSIDILTYVSGMSSDVNKIDTYLDVVRYVTSQHQPGEPLTEKDQQMLSEAYLQVEKFLVTNEQLRNFDVAGVRSDVVQHFNLDQSDMNQTFWSRIQAQGDAESQTS